MNVGDRIRIDLTGYALVGKTIWTQYNDEDGTSRNVPSMDFSTLQPESAPFSVQATQRETRPGGWHRAFTVHLVSTFDDQAVRTGVWTITAVDLVPEHERGPGGNGSMYESRAALGTSVWITCRQEKHTLRFTFDNGYTCQLLAERIQLVEEEAPCTKVL